MPTRPRLAGRAGVAAARLKVAPLAGFAFVSEDALARFRANFPFARAPMRSIPNGLDMRAWSATEPKDASILSVGRALADKGHIEAMAAIAERPQDAARLERPLHPLRHRPGA